jgi:hypothetical protein
MSDDQLALQAKQQHISSSADGENGPRVRSAVVLDIIVPVIAAQLWRRALLAKGQQVFFRREGDHHDGIIKGHLREREVRLSIHEVRRPRQLLDIAEIEELRRRKLVLQGACRPACGYPS